MVVQHMHYNTYYPFDWSPSDFSIKILFTDTIQAILDKRKILEIERTKEKNIVRQIILELW